MSSFEKYIHGLLMNFRRDHGKEKFNDIGKIWERISNKISMKESVIIRMYCDNTGCEHFGPEWFHGCNIPLEHYVEDSHVCPTCNEVLISEMDRSVRELIRDISFLPPYGEGPV